MPPKDLDTQRWEVHPLGAGHSIRNVKYGKYLSLKSVAKESPVVASDFPVAWDVKEIRVAEENAAFYEIRWPMTEFIFELADFGSSSPKTKIHLSDGQLPADQQRCRYWKANRIRQNSFYQPSPQVAQSQPNGNGAASSILGFAVEIVGSWEGDVAYTLRKGDDAGEIAQGSANDLL
ncbi:carbohydrate-binding module family 13 protein [Paxillus rubicundulus Ve08.2h10]|uniref:Carbohydrate-binding module family 13 protein n=1 Tax=Paxillus rubicundulus Ve08.2h10 TaxID=930991 RepID=A0A0D0CT05_9AGAM|nr:carbohydrate-binding module family 13 protein [Paxillus rubicundulus Ve08.2h10]